MPIRATPSCCSGLTGRYSCSGDRIRVRLRTREDCFRWGRSCLVAAGPTGQPIHRLFFRERDVLDDSGYCDDQHGRHSVCRAGGHQPHGLSTLDGNVHQSPGQRWGGSTTNASSALDQPRPRQPRACWVGVGGGWNFYRGGGRQRHLGDLAISFISSINLCKETSRSSRGWPRFKTQIRGRRQAS